MLLTKELERANTLVEDFLSSPECGEGCFDLDGFYGALTAVLCCPEYVGDVDLGFEVLGPEADTATLDAWFDEGEVRAARILIENSLGDALAMGTFDLNDWYPLLEGQRSPPEEFSRWCKGYLQGYMLTEEIWQEAYAFLNDEGMEEVEENHTALLSMMVAVANWDSTLAEHEDPSRLEEGLPQLLNAVNEGVAQVHLLAQILEENRLRAEEECQPVIRGIKIGRNDPCPCGSGRKYKKCCLQ